MTLSMLKRSMQKDTELSQWAKYLMDDLETLDSKKVIDNLTILLIYFQHRSKMV